MTRPAPDDKRKDIEIWMVEGYYRGGWSVTPYFSTDKNAAEILEHRHRHSLNVEKTRIRLYRPAEED